MPESLSHQAERFFQLFTELVRAYQFRDRDQVACHGLSVSQCYALETIDADGPLTMGELAASLRLDTSTITRLVDQLVSNGLAERIPDSSDRRVCRVRIAQKGRKLVSRIHAALIAEYEEILQATPPESREAVIDAVSQLLAAFRARQPRSCVAAARVPG